MVVDKSWLNNPNRSSDEYNDGLKSFLDMCKDRVDERGYVAHVTKKAQSRLETFRAAHTRRDGTIDSEAAETIRELEEELATYTQTDQGTLSQENVIKAFEKVMGTRRGWTRGIGYKPSSQAPVYHEESQAAPTPPLTQEQITMLFQDPWFRDQLKIFNRSQKRQSSDQDDDEEGTEDED